MIVQGRGNSVFCTRPAEVAGTADEGIHLHIPPAVAGSEPDVIFPERAAPLHVLFQTRTAAGCEIHAGAVKRHRPVYGLAGIGGFQPLNPAVPQLFEICKTLFKIEESALINVHAVIGYSVFHFSSPYV